MVIDEDYLFGLARIEHASEEEDLIVSLFDEKVLLESRRGDAEETVVESIGGRGKEGEEVDIV